MVLKIVPYSEEISFIVFNSINNWINMCRITFEFGKLPKIKFETHLRKIKGKSMKNMLIFNLLLYFYYFEEHEWYLKNQFLLRVNPEVLT